MNDPYLDQNNVRQRLLNTYFIYGGLIIACDFDDTLKDFRNVGFSCPKLIKLIQDLHKLNCKIIIYTAAHEERFPEIRQWCLDNLNIGEVAINLNYIGGKTGSSGKIYYNALLDDKAGLKSAYEDLSFFIEALKSNNSNLT